MHISKLLENLIEEAKRIGLPNEDIQNATEMLLHNEYGLCVDIVLTQLYEYDISITKGFYTLALDILNKIKINPNNYEYLRQLISNTK